MMSSKVFKAYDIRGISGEEIDPIFARRLGKAFFYLEHPKHILVGRDMRTSSEELEEALIDGLTASGANVTKIGLCSTPMFTMNFGLSHGVFDAGIMITASHNPAKYNGFKLAKINCVPIGQGTGMEQLRDLVLSEEPLLDASNPGTIFQDDNALDRYVNHVWKLANIKKPFPSLRIAVDTGNGMGGLIMPKIKSLLAGMEILPLYWDLDGTFPNHEANPLKWETLEALQKTVRDNNCTFGTALDGDGDRVGVVDERGTPIPGDILTALLARELLREHPGGLVYYDVRSSWIVQETIIKYGGKAEVCPVGHTFIKKKMLDTKALFAGELSCHFYFSQLWNAESPEFALFLLLNMQIHEKQPLSLICEQYRVYAHSGEINFQVTDPKTAIAQIKKKYLSRSTSVIDIDGIRLEFRDAEHPDHDWWFNIRASNTEPVLRLTLEAKKNSIMQQKKSELIQQIQAFSSQHS